MTDFELVEDVESERKLIEKAINEQGDDPEQNYGYFLSHDTEIDKCVYIRNGRYGIQTTYDKNTKEWVMIGVPIAPEEKQAELLKDALDFLSKQKILKKFVAESEIEMKKAIQKKLGSKYRIHSPSCVLYWPIYDMKTWTGDKLKGGEWKKIRNLINRMKKNHKIEIIDSVNADKDELKTMIADWAKIRNQAGFGINRKDSNTTDFDHYQKFVDLDFVGTKFAKTVVLDGKAVSVTVGWDIPNSKGAYYSGIGVYDLNIDNLGVYVNWSDLIMLKKAGYNEVNFGGSPKPLLQFKQKFKPTSQYTTHIYSITRNA